MYKKLLDGRSRIVLSVLGISLFIGVVMSFSYRVSSHDSMPLGENGAGQSGNGQVTVANPTGETGTLQKMIVANGQASMDLDLNRLNGIRAASRNSTLSFNVEPDAFFTILVFNNELRGTLPSSMGLIPQNSASLPTLLDASYNQLIIESLPWGGPYDLVVRNSQTGFVFFNVEGHQFNYDPVDNSLSIHGGRVLVSKEFATEIGRPTLAGTVVGSISVNTTMRAIEITQIVDGDATSETLPPSNNGENGTTPGPDVIVGDLSGLSQFDGSSNNQVGLAVGTDSCNAGVENLHWFANPQNDHPVIPQNLYRMSGGAANDRTFEQIGQSSVKHAFTALTNNICGFGCNGVGGSNLGSGCSDPYGAGLNSGPSLGSRGWINPFTGAYPRNDGATPNNNHSGHSHTGPSHRILTNITDLNTTLNPGATYYAEAQYITPHEYVWCQSHAGECNMYNNVSYRKYSVNGTGSPFTFSAQGSTVRTQPAVRAWPGATFVQFQPDPANDGIGIVAFKVTNPSPGVYHYEYAIYNQNLDRAIQGFSLPKFDNVPMTNVEFHAPPQHPGWSADGTTGNAGYSSIPWAQTEGNGLVMWGSETFAANQNANAIRWGTMYNIRFDSTRPPMTVNSTMSFLKTGAPISVTVFAPSPNPGVRPCYARQPPSERCAPV